MTNENDNNLIYQMFKSYEILNNRYLGLVESNERLKYLYNDIKGKYDLVIDTILGAVKLDQAGTGITFINDKTELDEWILPVIKVIAPTDYDNMVNSLKKHAEINKILDEHEKAKQEKAKGESKT